MQIVDELVAVNEADKNSIHSRNQSDVDTLNFSRDSVLHIRLHPF